MALSYLLEFYFRIALKKLSKNRGSFWYQSISKMKKKDHECQYTTLPQKLVINWNDNKKGNLMKLEKTGHLA